MANPEVSTINSNMADYPWLLQAAAGDAPPEYSAANLRMLVDATWKNEGVCDSAYFAVTAGGGNSVNIASGFAVIKGDNVTGQGKYLVGTYGVVNVTVPALPVSGTRFHLLVAEVLDKQVTGTSYGWQFRCIEDTTGVQPAVPNNAIPLARVTRTLGGSAAVVAGDIADLRPAAYTTPYTPPASTATNWVTISSFGTGWTQNVGDTAIEYRRDDEGTVHLRGLIRTTVASNANVMFTLPAGFRTGVSLIYPAAALITGNNTTRLTISSTGGISIYVSDQASFPATGWVSFGGISFSTR